MFERGGESPAIYFSLNEAHFHPVIIPCHSSDIYFRYQTLRPLESSHPFKKKKKKSGPAFGFVQCLKKNFHFPWSMAIKLI